MSPADYIIAQVARAYGLTPEDLKGRSRIKHISRARQEAMFRIKNERSHLSLPAIGRAFENRDHTTVLHGYRRHLARWGFGGLSLMANDNQPLEERHADQPEG